MVNSLGNYSPVSFVMIFHEDDLCSSGDVSEKIFEGITSLMKLRYFKSHKENGFSIERIGYCWPKCPSAFQAGTTEKTYYILPVTSLPRIQKQY